MPSPSDFRSSAQFFTISVVSHFVAVVVLALSGGFSLNSPGAIIACMLGVVGIFCFVVSVRTFMRGMEGIFAELGKARALSPATQPGSAKA